MPTSYKGRVISEVWIGLFITKVVIVVVVILHITWPNAQVKIKKASSSTASKSYLEDKGLEYYIVWYFALSHEAESLNSSNLNRFKLLCYGHILFSGYTQPAFHSVFYHLHSFLKGFAIGYAPR